MSERQHNQKALVSISHQKENWTSGSPLRDLREPRQILVSIMLNPVSSPVVVYVWFVLRFHDVYITAALQKVLGSNPGLGFSERSLHVLPLDGWFLSGYSGLLG
ncbi:hypothetical protein ATANTOWER_001425 [Ataeniobius toweri]|uniref:Uncharacterized protein n=1 Tax=Ataeniobius toweri TaxID=208326 RepID=A0ABU7BZ98_9TELE|nr:hypothetical protein [Ataeniobius toweri]